MTRLTALLAALTGVAVLLAAATASAGSLGTAASTPLTVGGGANFLILPRDRAIVRYSVESGSPSVRGTLYVRNDRQRAFTRLPLTRKNAYLGRVPASLLRGHRLFYYAVFRDPRTRRSTKLPAAGARAPRTAWILAKPIVVPLGTHRFGETRTPDAVVARASAGAVGWRDPGPGEGLKAGPQTALIGRDGSVWLDDDVNNRLLVWRPGQPDTIAQTVPLPYGADGGDFTFGPGGSLYVTRVAGVGTKTHLVLDRLTASGATIWESALGGYYSPLARTFVLGVNDPLRTGPDGTLYCLVFMGMSGAGEWGWMPVATSAGSPIPPAAQRSRMHWPFQPVARGLRLVGPETYTPHDDMAPRELRYALVDRHERVVRSWRILSGTDLNLHGTVTDLAGTDPVVFLEFAGEYEVLRLGPHGARDRFSVPRGLWGDTAEPDLRVGPDGRLYQLTTSPQTGVVIGSYAL